MDYYEKKRKCMTIIEKFAKSSKLSREDIAFEVLKMTGFSKKFVNDYIDLSIERGFFKESKGLIKAV